MLFSEPLQFPDLPNRITVRVCAEYVLKQGGPAVTLTCDVDDPHHDGGVFQNIYKGYAMQSQHG